MSVPDRTPFQHPAWLLPWWDVFGAGDLHVLEIRSGGRLAGLAPLYLARSPEGSRELRLIGEGVSDYLDVLSMPAARRSVVRAIERELTRSAGEWTCCAFDHLRPGSVLLDVTAPPDVEDVTQDDEPCPALALPASVEDLPGAIGSRLAKNIRYERRRAEQDGGIAIEQAAPDTIDDLLTALFELHGRRWSARGERGVLAGSAVRAFHRAAAPALLAAGLLRMHVLRIGGRTAAIYYGMHAADRACFYLAGFDPAFASRSPGTLATAAAVERAIEDGASVFDFLSGREAYKYQWRAIDRPRLIRRLVSRRGSEAA